MSTAVEEVLWQGCAENGTFSRAVTMHECQYGALHATAHLWLWRLHDDRIEFLMQRRSPDVKTWQGFWDISSAGHIDAGHSAIETACREAEEELGLRFSGDDLQLLFVHRQILDFDSRDLGRIIENEFQWVYGHEVTQPDEFELVDGEASEAAWFGVPEIRDMISGASKEHVVPHGNVYFELLFSTLERLERGRAIIARR